MGNSRSLDLVACRREAGGWYSLRTGGAISGSWQLFERFIPFVRLGAAKGGGAFYDRSASVGLGYVTGSEDNVIGFGANWSRPNEDIYGKDINTQFTMEAYWRMKFTNWLEITTDIQYVDNPALDPEKSSLRAFVARFRAAF
jgi:porin